MIVDAHFHLGYTYSRFHFYDTSIEQYLNYMDRLHIATCMNIHSIGLVTGELEQGMEANIAAYEQSAGRILSYLVFNPNDVVRSLKVMERYYEGNIFRAVKLHPSMHGVCADDPRYEAAWEFAAAHNLPIMSHTWTPSSYNPSQQLSYPPLFEAYIAKYSTVNLICGHAGGRIDGIRQTIKLARTYDNVYMDTAGDVYNNKLIDFLVGEVGSDRIVFGSDGFLMDARSQLGMILDAAVPISDKENMLFKNAMRLFRL
ncbi:amidohydrolase family protein [Paenibacillus eucommiae]|uniref:TIM-barrel fold metal-dependent hydrolase n=1 Tax=Paenibacillus eucommiae TaxID=1355755 RepID=A0ABS4J1G9_9BACL|nr:amidohydrolase family protein [Paenibacillus eucommiae]MBP1993680.1 putative TIM-barrel fold metal-dependent hydrolase [Paenibacillus eucommiae]